MKKKLLQELKDRTTVELKKSLKDKREELSRVSLDITLSKSKDTASVKNLKKDIARIKLFLSMKEESR